MTRSRLSRRNMGGREEGSMGDPGWRWGCVRNQKTKDIREKIEDQDPSNTKVERYHDPHTWGPTKKRGTAGVEAKYGKGVKCWPIRDEEGKKWRGSREGKTEGSKNGGKETWETFF